MTNKIWKLPKRETELWVEALRSGKYKQGTGNLYRHDSDSYCCLGVWCDVHYSEYKEHWKTCSFITLENVNVPDELYGADYDNLAYILACLNDGNIKAVNIALQENNIEIDYTNRDFSFVQIADFIEKYVEYV